MSVHDVCTLYAGGCLRNISSVSPWYPLVGIPIGVHSPYSARSGHPSRLKIDTLARPLPAFNCSEEIFAMDILVQSRFTFRQGHTVQPFAMVNGKQVCRYQDVSKESQTRGHSVRIVWQIEAASKQVCLRQSRLGSGQAPPKKTTVPATPWRRGQGSATPHEPQFQCQCRTIDTWCRLLSMVSIGGSISSFCLTW